MNYVFVLGGLFVVHMLALISPGPNLLIVTQTAVSYNRRTGILVAMGLATGAAIWSTAALVGLNVVFAYITWLYGALRLLGGIYLIYLGVKIWRTANQEFSPLENLEKPIQTHWQSFRLGLLTTLTNPKAGIFFGGIFAALLPPDFPFWMKIIAILLVILDSAVFHIGLALFFSTNRVKQIYRRIKVYVDRLAGAALTFLGLRILFGNR